MIDALFRSVPGVLNAFVVLFIVFCIYAILAVELFRDVGVDGIYATGGPFGDNGTVTAETLRGFAYGREYFGTFMRAMYTLFQVMTGESWAEAVARPVIFGYQATIAGFFCACRPAPRIAPDCHLDVAVCASLCDWSAPSAPQPWLSSDADERSPSTLPPCPSARQSSRL